jgi:hypothetical protein
MWQGTRKTSVLAVEPSEEGVGVRERASEEKEGPLLG